MESSVGVGFFESQFLLNWSIDWPMVYRLASGVEMFKYLEGLAIYVLYFKL
jgi:hypothetical protein